MKFERQVVRTAVIDALGDRELVWAGIRGDDIEPLSDLPQLKASFSIINAYDRRGSVQGIAYEDFTKRRVDLEVWDVDEQLEAPATRTFRQGLLKALSRPSALLPYRPSRFLSAIVFARRKSCVNLGLFGALQNAFEHKPWVESSVADLGIPVVPWVYLADEEQRDADRLLAAGPVLLRRSRTSGGEGIVKVETIGELQNLWPHLPEAFVCVAPFFEGALPINVGATVWGPETVSVHRPSLQLIGIPELVGRPFGYCGNDFTAAQDLDRTHIDAIEERVQKIGRWLARHGYLGTFGVDFLLHDGELLFTEINARFQGSTHLSSQLSIEADEPCLMLEHIAASLRLEPTEPPPLHERMRERVDKSHVVVHWTGTSAASGLAAPVLDRLREVVGYARAEVVASTDVEVEPGAAVLRATFARSVTTDGYSVAPVIAESVATAWKENATC